MKEIWYLWDKKTIVEGVVKAMRCDGMVANFAIGGWSDVIGISSVDNEMCLAYTLGETRERVGCDGCDGAGLATDFNDGEVTVYEDEACPDCKGTGKVWIYGVAP